MAKKKENHSPAEKVGLGIGLTAAAVAAAGAYFLYGSKDANKNRKTVKSWMLKAKAEVLEQLEKAQEMSKEEYEQVIDTVGGAYAAIKDVSKTEVDTFKKEMKTHWDHIEKKGKKVSGTLKKVAKPARKTTAKKAPAKKVVANKPAAKKAAPKKAAAKKTGKKK